MAASTHNTTGRRIICLFGLSADPPTVAHIAIAQRLLVCTELDEILILPVYQHTFSAKQGRLVSFSHRLHMCELSFEDLQGVRVSDAEYESWKKALPAEASAVGTAALIDYLETIYTNVDFVLCLGTDAFLDLVAGKWRESERILQNEAVYLWVVARGPPTLSFPTMPPRSRILNDIPLIDISSSQVRQCRDISELASMVHPKVLEYIQERRLYMFADDGVICDGSSTEGCRQWEVS